MNDLGNIDADVFRTPATRQQRSATSQHKIQLAPGFSVPKKHKSAASRCVKLQAMRECMKKLDFPIADFLMELFTSNDAAIKRDLQQALQKPPKEMWQPKEGAPQRLLELLLNTVYNRAGRNKQHRVEVVVEAVETLATRLIEQETKKAMEEKEFKIIATKTTHEEILQKGDVKHVAEITKKIAPFTLSMFESVTQTQNKWERRLAGKSARRDRERSLSIASNASSINTPGLDEAGRASVEDTDTPSRPISRKPGAAKYRARKAKELDGYEASHSRIRDAEKCAVRALHTCYFVLQKSCNSLATMDAILCATNGLRSTGFQTLSNQGVVSTLETARMLQATLTDGAVLKAKEVVKESMHGGNLAFVQQDNVNIALPSSDQTLTNRNTQINATNVIICRHQPGVSAKPLLTGRNDRAAQRPKRFEADCREILFNNSPEVIRYKQDCDKFHIVDALLHGLEKCGLKDLLGGDRVRDKKIADFRKAWKSLRPDVNRVMCVDVDGKTVWRKTETFPMKTMDRNQGTIDGTIGLLSDLNDLLSVTDDFVRDGGVIPIASDLGGVKNMRGAQKVRESEDDPKRPEERLDHYTLSSSLFHFSFNFLELLNNRGWIGENHTVSGSHHAHVLGRTGLAPSTSYDYSKNVKFHRTRFQAFIMAYACSILGYEDPNEISQWKPRTFEDVLDVAQKIAADYTSTRAGEEAMYKNEDEEFAIGSFFCRDWLLFCELDDATRWGDAGRIMKLLPELAVFYRGAGAHQYANECLNILLFFTVELADPIYDNFKMAIWVTWFVNTTGKEGACKASDLHMEHFNYWVKAVFAAKGPSATLEYVQRFASANIESLRFISTTYARSWGTAIFQRSHQCVDDSADILRLLNDIFKSSVEKVSDFRRPAPKANPDKAEVAAAQLASVENIPHVTSVFNSMGNGAVNWPSKYENVIYSRIPVHNKIGFHRTAPRQYANSQVSRSGTQDVRLPDGDIEHEQVYHTRTELEEDDELPSRRMQHQTLWDGEEDGYVNRDMRPLFATDEFGEDLQDHNIMLGNVNNPLDSAGDGHLLAELDHQIESSMNDGSMIDDIAPFDDPSQTVYESQQPMEVD